MGLLGKLFGDDDIEKKAKGFFDDLVKSVQNPPQNNAAPSQPAAQSYSAPVQSASPAQGASGFSWGDTMPDEENQFNSGLSYHEYFEKIYKEEFSDYDVSKEIKPSGKGCEFTFTKDGRVALKVEVISRSSNPYKVRNDCRKAGIGYTRFYHDNHGWWNTRRYVIERTGNAIR